MNGSTKPPTHQQQQLIEVLTSIADRLCEIRDLLRGQPQICRSCATDPCPLPSGPGACEGYTDSLPSECRTCRHVFEPEDQPPCSECRNPGNNLWELRPGADRDGGCAHDPLAPIRRRATGRGAACAHLRCAPRSHSRPARRPARGGEPRDVNPDRVVP